MSDPASCPVTYPESIRLARLCHPHSDRKTFTRSTLPSTLAGGPRKVLRAEYVVEIRYMSASEATTRYGTGYTAGLLLVTTGGDGPQARP